MNMNFVVWKQFFRWQTMGWALPCINICDFTVLRKNMILYLGTTLHFFPK